MRRYGKRGKYDPGLSENKTRCVVAVYVGLWDEEFQCSRRRGFGPDGLYCLQHAKMLATGKQLNVPEDEA